MKRRVLLYLLIIGCATTSKQRRIFINIPPAKYNYQEFLERPKIKIVSMIGDSALITDYCFNPYYLYDTQRVKLIKDEKFKKIIKKFFEKRGINVVNENEDLTVYFKLDILTLFKTPVKRATGFKAVFDFLWKGTTIESFNFCSLLAIKVKIFKNGGTCIFDKISARTTYISVIL